MRGISAILILLILSTASATRTLGTGRLSRILERNNLLVAPTHPDVLAMVMNTNKYRLKVDRGVGLPQSFPASYGIKTKSGDQEARGAMTPTCRFKDLSKCPRNAWFSRSLPVRETEESFSDKIGRKLIEQGVLQALAFD